MVIHQFCQMRLQQTDDGERRPSGNKSGPLFEDILPRQNRVDNRGVRARPPDPLPFQFLRQSRFAEAGRGLGGVPLGEQIPNRNGVANFYRRQNSLLIAELRVGIVGAFHIGPQIARELNRFARYLKLRAATLDLQSNRMAAGIHHLAGDRPFPNQIEQPKLVVVQLVAERFRNFERVTGGADRFVGFLGVFDFAAIDTGRVRQVLIAVLRSHQLPRGIDGDLC